MKKLIRSDNADAMNNLALMHSYLDGDKDVKREFELLDKAVLLDLPSAKVNRAKRHYIAKEFKEAFDLIEQAIAQRIPGGNV